MKQLIGLSVFFFVMLFAFNIQAQQWSPEQKDVWAGVQKYWEIDNNNPLAYFKYFDD